MSVHRHMPDAARWTLCFAFVLVFHVAGAAALFARWSNDVDPVAEAPVITVELAPFPVAPETKPTNAAPGPQQTRTPPAQEAEKPNETEQPEMKTASVKDAEISVMPPPKEPKKQQQVKKHQVASLDSMPSPAEQKAARTAARNLGAASHDPNALPNWKSELVARLERYKRYPADAQARGETGVAQVAFSVDRSGYAHNPRIVRSSGSASLDRATLDLIARAQPLPPPPADVHGAQIAIAVPIRYSAR
ncbi:MAG TPA: energy transducer TonB [Pseudolabrys sp.]|nr:energy transducer TonB [Pseudolabrys sp.]